MGAVHVFGTVRGIRECFATTLVLADVRALSCVRTKMSLEVLQTRVGFVATFILQGRERGREERERGGGREGGREERERGGGGGREGSNK